MVIVRRRIGGGMVAVAYPSARGSVMRVGRHRSRAGGRRGQRAVHWARLQQPRLPDNEREPEGETGRQRTKPRRSTHAE